MIHSKPCRLALLSIFFLAWMMPTVLHAQSEEPSPSPPQPSAEEANLAGQESRLADRFDRLELLDDPAASTEPVKPSDASSSA